MGTAVRIPMSQFVENDNVKDSLPMSDTENRSKLED